MRRRNRLSDAFTLVELLVVIGIIALLISVLLPALNKAREQSYKVKCLSNIRQLGQALSIYAAENKDCVPLGTMISWDNATNKPTTSSAIENWFSYFAFWKNGNTTFGKPTGLGKLATIKILQSSPQAYYCPKEDREGLSYDSGADINPWAYKVNPPTSNRHTYIAYWVRPIAAFPASDFADGPVMLEGFYSADSAAVLTNLPKGWPKFSKLKNKAIISDIARTPHDIKARHKDGVNVYYANGSGKYVRQSDFEKATGTGTPGIPGPIPQPGTPGIKWKDQVWGGSTIPGHGAPSTGDATYGNNTIYLNSFPSFPLTAGFWNWLDKAP